ncbi:MAG: hypothetical protein ACRED5_10135, partial [Propylenella sp.]
SGGDDGTVRLWTLDGKAAAEPFTGHAGSVWSVAFSPEGTRIVSGGEDGTVRLWGIDARESKIVAYCHASRGLGFVGNFAWIGCSDRIAIQSQSFERRGDLFLHAEGIFAIVGGEGTFVPSSRVREPFWAVAKNGTVFVQPQALQPLLWDRVRQVMFDKWTPLERVVEVLSDTYQVMEAWYSRLEIWWKASFWPALAWALAVTAATTTWLFAPHMLAHWAMPAIGSPPLPKWRGVTDILVVFGYLGTTRRPLKAWLRRNRDVLYEQNFAGREPVKERSRFSNLSYQPDIGAFASQLAAGKSTLRWIDGVGGSGKSALAFEMLRVATANNKRAPLPVLIDEDWRGTLADHIAQLLRVGERAPTSQMVVTLGAAGHLCPLIDSLSERGVADAVDQVGEAVGNGWFKSLVVTSRQEKPGGQVWERFAELAARPLTADDIPDYIAAYAPDSVAEVRRRIEPLIVSDKPISPLFVRFAIEQAMVGDVASTSALGLVLQYVEALRAGKVDLGADDMRRSASIAAVEAIRDDLVPREISSDYLRGVLQTDADRLAFMNAAGNGKVDPAAIIEMLVECGLLNRNFTNGNLQFAYDPVAEHLAARWISQAGNKERVDQLRTLVLAKPDSAVAAAMADLERTAA